MRPRFMPHKVLIGATPMKGSMLLSPDHHWFYGGEHSEQHQQSVLAESCCRRSYDGYPQLQKYGRQSVNVSSVSDVGEYATRDLSSY